MPKTPHETALALILICRLEAKKSDWLRSIVDITLENTASDSISLPEAAYQFE